MPLAICPLGEPVVIQKTPSESAAKRRLETLGIIIGETVTPIAETGGNIILKVGASKIALNRELAMRIRAGK